jgi:uncharacterized protein YecE (DUF72 family)
MRFGSGLAWDHRLMSASSVPLRGRARVGCSGWSYSDWRGPVYPVDLPTTDWFASYTDRFDTVELNTTFYRLPQASTVDNWRRRAPAGFVYAVKVGQFGSHRMKLRDPARWLANHLDRVGRLGETLGPNLVQLPPNWRRDTARLDEFLAAAPATMRWAVEFREPSWLHDDVYEVLASHRAALCVHDLLAEHPWERTTDWAYVRFHGPDARSHPYHGRYGPRRLRDAGNRIEQWLDAGYDVYAYFNNDFGGAAVADATWLAHRVGIGVRAHDMWRLGTQPANGSAGPHVSRR